MGKHAWLNVVDHKQKVHWNASIGEPYWVSSVPLPDSGTPDGDT